MFWVYFAASSGFPVTIPNKAQTGRPTVYTTERDHDNVTLRVWPTPDKAYTLFTYVFVKPDDAAKYTQNIRIQPRYLPAIIDGLAVEIGLDRPSVPPEKLQTVKASYEQKLTNAMTEDRERTSFIVRPEITTRL